MLAGGALFILSKRILAKENSTIKLVHNRALDGGAIQPGEYSSITFCQHSVIWFYNNTATQQGGAIKVARNITFTGSSNISFINNEARQGAAIHFARNAQLLSSGSCFVIFQSNSATYQAGALYLFNNVAITLKGQSTMMFIDNTAQQNAGAIYIC